MSFSPSLVWSIVARVFLQDLYAKNTIRSFRKNCGELLCGLLPVSPVAAAALLFPSSDSISNNRIPLFRTAPLSAPYILALKNGVFR